MTKSTVAVIGTGVMGSAMAARLLDDGHTVRVWNRSPEPLKVLGDAGAVLASDPDDAVAGATVVITMLPTASVADEVMVGGGVIAAIGSGAVWAQMGTLGIDATRTFAEAVQGERPDVLFVDVPVSGSKVPAERGELLVLASGPPAARAIVDPVFEVIGKRTVWLGPAGMGSRMKLVLNTWLAFEIEAAAEIAALTGAFGIADEALTDTIDGSPLVSTFAATKLAKMQARDDTTEFSLAWALKDLDLVTEAAPDGAAPIARAIAERWRGLSEDGAGALDVSAARRGLDDGSAN